MSSADKSTGAADPKALTVKETQILAHAWSCMDNDPQINYEALAPKIGQKNATAAYKVIWKIKRKLAEMAEQGTPGPVTPKKGANKRAAATADDGDDDDAQTPSKKRKTPTKPRAKKCAAKAKAESDGEDEDMDEMDDDDAAAV